MAMNIRLILFIIRWKENGEGSIMWELRQVEHSLLNIHGNQKKNNVQLNNKYVQSSAETGISLVAEVQLMLSE